MAASESALFTGFSSPTEAFEESFLHLLASQYARAILEVFLDRFRAELEPYPGVTDKLEELAASDLEFNAIWSPALTKCFRATSVGNSSIARNAAAETLLHGAANGLIGDWEIQLEKARSFLWDSWLLPKCDHLSFSNTGEMASLIIRDEGSESRIVFRRTSNGAGQWSGESGTPLPTTSTEYGSIVMLPEGVINPTDLDGFRDNRAAATIPSELSRNFESALNLFRDSLPSFNNWVRRVIRTASIADPAQMDDLKGSMFPGACAVAFIYDGQDMLEQAESLIHAAAHNYFYLLTTLGSPVDPLSSMLYYSPFVRMMRTFDRVLASYHAFANGYLFYRSCRDTLPEYKETCTERMKNTRADLRRAEKEIGKSNDLTPIGSALIEPLIKQLRNEA